jgi:hypothetical protein
MVDALTNRRFELEAAPPRVGVGEMSVNELERHALAGRERGGSLHHATKYGAHAASA